MDNFRLTYHLVCLALEAERKRSLALACGRRRLAARHYTIERALWRWLAVRG